MLLSKQLGTLLAVLLILGCASTVHAFSITNVTVLPDIPLTPDINVQLFTGITTPSQDAMLFMPTTVDQTGNGFTVEIFITDGMILPATDFLEESVDLGMLAAGEYSYLVRITAGYFVNFGIREVEGTFTVVPIPAAVWLLAAALGMLAGLKRG